MCQAGWLGRPTSIPESQSLASPVHKNAGIVYELACLPSATRQLHEIAPAIVRRQVSTGGGHSKPPDCRRPLPNPTPPLARSKVFPIRRQGSTLLIQRIWPGSGSRPLLRLIFVVATRLVALACLPVTVAERLDLQHRGAATIRRCSSASFLCSSVKLVLCGQPERLLH